MTDRTPGVLAEVAAERDQQDQKWGEQNHPLVDQGIMARLTVAQNRRGIEPATRRNVAAALFREYELPDAGYARQMCEAAARRGECTWAHILIEELCEFVEAPAERDDDAARAELVQLAAVAVAAVERIDRQQGRQREPAPFLPPGSMAAAAAMDGALDDGPLPVVEGECSQIMWTDRGSERCGHELPCPDHDPEDADDD